MKVLRFAVMALLCWPAAAIAHHNGHWAHGAHITIEGYEVDHRITYPHSRLTLDVDGELWQLDIGQPWMITAAGLDDAHLGSGKRLRVTGAPSQKAGDHRLKVETITIGEDTFSLYPRP